MKYIVRKSFFHRSVGYVHAIRGEKLTDGIIDLPSTSKEDREANASLLAYEAIEKIRKSKAEDTT